jgi:hypothetical protein
MSQESNDQQQPVATATATPENEPLVSLQQAATTCGVKEVTLRSWCKKKRIKWHRAQNGAKTRWLVLISDVRAYLTKRNPTAVSTAGLSPAMPPQTEKPVTPQAPAAVLQEPASGAEPDSPPTAPTHAPARADHVAPKATAVTTSVTPAVDVTTAVPHSTAAAKQAAAHPPASPKQKTKPPREAPSGLLVHRAKKSMRKFGAEELQKLAAWIKQRLANKFASNTNPDPSKQPTPAS